MYLCYVDESGTSAVPGNSSHFVLVGISIPIWEWRRADQEINAISKRYDLDGVEIHTAWMLRAYLEQRKIPNFESLSADERRAAVKRARAAQLLQLQKGRNPKAYKQAKKNYRHTEDYVHLTHEQRVEFIVEVASAISSWEFATVFAECIDKLHFDPAKANRSIDEQAFEQIVSRFEQYVRRQGNNPQTKGIIVHDNNQTVALKHTTLMRDFHSQGTLWTSVERIIETPMFVDSKLTGMVQMADLCSFATRRYVENQEADLFNLIYKRADTFKSKAVGFRHYSTRCTCVICKGHTGRSTPRS